MSQRVSEDASQVSLREFAESLYHTGRLLNVSCIHAVYILLLQVRKYAGMPEQGSISWVSNESTEGEGLVAAGMFGRFLTGYRNESASPEPPKSELRFGFKPRYITFSANYAAEHMSRPVSEVHGMCT